MPIHEIRVTPVGDDPLGHEIQGEAERVLGVTGLDAVHTAKVYRVEGPDADDAYRLGYWLFADRVNEDFSVNEVPARGGHTVHVAYKQGVMNPESSSIIKAADDLGVTMVAADSSREYTFAGSVTPEVVDTIVGRLLVNKTVQEVVGKEPATLTFEGSVGPVDIVPVREASLADLAALSKDKLFLDSTEMTVIQEHFRTLNRDPTDVELEIIAARWSEHCGHKTFNARVMVDGVEKPPLYTRIKEAARANFGDRIVSAFGDNAGVMKFYEGMAVSGKVETHNSPSAIEPYGGAMTGTGGVFRDIMGTGQGARVIISTDMFCFAPPDLDESLLPPGTLHPDHLQRRVVQGVRDYGNRFGAPTANGSVHYHPDFRAKPTVIVGAYGILPEARAQKGEPLVGDLVVIIGGRTGRDGIHGATFSSGEMTDRTASVNSSAVQIGNAIEQKRMTDALTEARDLDYIRAITDCGAAGFSSAIGEIGEGVGVTVDISKAPTKYPGLAPWEIWLSESQERMVAAIAPENIDEFLSVCKKYNVESTVLGEFDGSHTLTVNYGDQNVAELDYEFLENGLPQRVMEAHWEPTEVPEIRPAPPASPAEWIDRFQSVLAHGNVCSKEPIVRQYDHGVQGGNIVPPFGGVDQSGPNDALVIRPMLGKPYGVVQSHGMNPILNRYDPYEGTKWAIAEAAANYVSAGGDITEAAAVGNYIWPFPDAKAMGSLDRSVDAAVEMMHTLKLPVISGKDSLSSTYRGKDGAVIEIPPVYAMSVFGRIPDVAKTMTTEFKNQDSQVYLVGALSEGMGGSTYYDVAGGSSNAIPTIDAEVLSQTLHKVHQGIVSGEVLACHDVSEGGVAAAVAEMCFGSKYGIEILLGDSDSREAEDLLFSETAGCFVIEVQNGMRAKELFQGLPCKLLGYTTVDQAVRATFDIDSAGERDETLFEASVAALKKAWQAPMKEVFHT